MSLPRSSSAARSRPARVVLWPLLALFAVAVLPVVGRGVALLVPAGDAGSHATSASSGPHQTSTAATPPSAAAEDVAAVPATDATAPVSSAAAGPVAGSAPARSHTT